MNGLQCLAIVIILLSIEYGILRIANELEKLNKHISGAVEIEDIEPQESEDKE